MMKGKITRAQQGKDDGCAEMHYFRDCGMGAWMGSMPVKGYVNMMKF